MPANASISRRHLLSGRALAPAFQPRPPGVSAESLSACTGCGLCVGACPEKILDIADKRVILLVQAGECSFCGDCATACPEPVFGAERVMQHRVEITPDCLAHAGITCMSCRDICPEAAISMQPRIGGPFLPVLNEALCSGCGACVAPCPGAAIIAVERMALDA